MDDGLLARLITIVARPAVMGKDRSGGEAVKRYNALVERLHREGDSLSLKLDAGARDVRKELEAKHLKMISVGAVNRKLASHIGKFNGLFARLCVVWHCIENERSHTVKEDTAERVAKFLHKFLFPHAVAFYTSVVGLSDDYDVVKATAGYILSRKLDRITYRDMQRGDSHMRNLSRFEMDKILHQLDSHGWLICEPGEQFNRPDWIVNPRVHSKFEERANEERKRRREIRETIDELFGEKSP
jgi:hypothetical protein